MYLACEIRLKFKGLDGTEEENCPTGKDCFQIEITSGCVSVTNTEACLEYADEEVSPNQESIQKYFELENSVKLKF